MLCFLDGHGLSELRGAIEILSSLRRMCTVKVFNECKTLRRLRVVVVGTIDVAKFPELGKQILRKGG